jgi:UDP-N-acetylmuramoyl-L-alanyl-D-glutamate--2,6-diaminopimelate ligase
MAPIQTWTGSLAVAGVPFRELVLAADARIVFGDPDIIIGNVQYDSRKVGPGDLFVALRGGYADGHDFLADARSRGAVAALIEDECTLVDFDAVAVATNTREALSPLSACFFNYPGEKLGIIGVTGTDGKTTTSYLIDAMLRAKGMQTGLVGTIAVRIGDELLKHDTRQTTPESLEVQRLLADMRGASVDWSVLEATSHALALYRLNDVPFDIGVITNITREHLDFHGSVEEYRAAKARLIRRVESSVNRRFEPAVIANLDDPGAREVAATSTVPVTWFSTHDRSADLFADRIRVHTQGTSFRCFLGDSYVDVDLKLIGEYNVFNAMASIGAGMAAGLSFNEACRGVESLSNVPGRMQRVACGQPFNVIVDYAHSPASLEQTLRLVRQVTEGRVILVMGSAGERDRGKRPVQGRLAAELADFSVFTSEDARFEDPDMIIAEIAQGALDVGAREGVDFIRVEDRRTAIETAIGRAASGDAVLLTGKGHESSMIYGNERVPWDEELEARRALERLGFSMVPNAEGHA